MTLTGKCLCGNITYKLDITEIPQSVICNCNNCKITTSSCSNNLPVFKNSVKVTKGSPKIYNDKETSSGQVMYRHFCGDCGTPLWSSPTVEQMAEVAFVKVGSLDQADQIQAGSVLFKSRVQNGLLNIEKLAAA